MAVLVTRPEGKADGLIAQLNQAGLTAYHQPLLTSTPITTDSHFPTPDVAVFISQDAVASFCEQHTLAPTTLLVAVGKATQTALQNAFQREVLCPKQHDSEGLLALPLFQQIAGKHVLLVKGEGGRALIQDTLLRDGALLTCLEVYRREPIEGDRNQWVSNWQQQQINSIVITSVASFDALIMGMSDESRTWLSQCQFVVVSQRIQSHLLDNYIAPEQIRLSQGASDHAICKALVAESQPTSVELSQTMTDSTQPSEIDTQQDAPKAASQKGVWFVLLLVIAGFAGASWYVWQWMQNQAQQNDALSAQLSELKAEKSQAQNAVNLLKRELDAKLIALQQAQRTLNAQHAELAQNTLEVSQSVQALQTDEPQLRISEVQRLVHSAEFYLVAQQNPKASINVLKQLDDVLAPYPRMMPLREAIASDILVLSSYQVVDTQSHYVRLSALAKALEQAQINSINKAKNAVLSEAQVVSQDHNDWQANLLKVWHNLTDQFITVRTHSQPIEPLLGEGDVNMVRSRISLLLEQAKLALLKGEQNTFNQAIKDTHDLVVRYYDEDDFVVQEILTQLARYQALTVTQSLPDGLKTSRAFEQVSL